MKVLQLLLAVQGARLLLFDIALSKLCLAHKTTSKAAFAESAIMGTILFGVFYGAIDGLLWGLGCGFIGYFSTFPGTRIFAAKATPGIPSKKVFSQTTDAVCMLECNIDDMSGESFGDIMSRLFAIGVLDVFFTPVYGKKNRPLYMLSVLTPPELEAAATAELFSHTTTAGVRRRSVERYTMGRSFMVVSVYGYNIDVKKLEWKGSVKFVPEWDDCVKVSEQAGKTTAEIYSMAVTEAIQVGS